MILSYAQQKQLTFRRMKVHVDDFGKSHQMADACFKCVFLRLLIATAHLSSYYLEIIVNYSSFVQGFWLYRQLTISKYKM